MTLGGGPNPGIWGDSVRKALNPNDEHGARVQAAGAEQQLLDKAELREIELSTVYGGTAQAPEVARTDQPPRPRGFLARLFRRSA
jgi:hypothetical protein